jgi:signal transduction histidine kinase
MDASGTSGDAGRSDLRDLVSFNRWLCLTRFRAAGGVLLFTLLLRLLGIGTVETGRVVSVCCALFVVSMIGLRSSGLAARPRLFFHLQNVADLTGITFGIAFSAHGVEALLFRPLFALVIVPASLISVPGGLATAAAASVGHVALLAWERGPSASVVFGVEALSPAFLFFLIAQQCFFYGTHLARKNDALAALAERLEDSSRRLLSQARTSAALLDVARTLSSTLEAPELVARVNGITCQQLGADWSASFLVDPERGTFRLMAMTGVETGGDLARLEFPASGWAPVGRLADQPVVVLTGADAERTPGVFASERRVSTVILAALYHDGALRGFLAAGFGTLADVERERALEFLAGIAQHATIVLRNARLLEEVRLASAMKSEFAGAVSHELRSPLNVMLGYLEMLLDEGLGPVTDEQRDALRRTQRQSLALLEMITALLDLNRLEAGRLPVERRPVAIADLLDEIRQQLPDGWRRADVALRVDVDATLPPIRTDAGKLKTCIRNLLHNAFKFTERGEVTLSARPTAAGDLAIAVRDTGCGIPDEAMRYIFDMFRQVPGAGGGGVGLGLHLVRRLVEALGGTVSVTSEVGVGSCFTITLPAAEARVPALRPAPAHAA